MSPVNRNNDAEQEKLKAYQNSFLKSGGKSVLQKNEVFIKESGGIRKK